MSEEKKIGSGIVGGTKVGFYKAAYEYNPGNVAILAYCEDECPEPFGDISVNLSNKMEPGEFVVNHDMERHEKDLLATGLFEETGKRVDYGFIRQRPIWRIKKE